MTGRINAMEIRLKRYIDEKFAILDEKMKRYSSKFYNENCETCEKFLSCETLTNEGETK